MTSHKADYGPFDVAVRKPMGTDQQMSAGEGCLDCLVGEPHACPNLVWGAFMVEADEHGSHSVRWLAR